MKQSIIDDIITDLRQIRSQNVTSKKDLRSVLGKLVYAAGLLIVMRPFMEPVWAAWDEDSPERHPNCVWSLQIGTETKLSITFFTGHGAAIVRFFSLDAYNRVGATVVIGTNASPWGLGGWLMVDGVIKEHFASPITPTDVTEFGFDIGCKKGQQVCEALAILVAADLWAEHW